MKRTLIALAIVLVSATAFAQPGNTPPQPSPEQQPAPQGQPELPPDQGQGMPPVEQQPAQINYDELLARAQAASPTIEKVVRGAFRRARRAISVGPTVGLWGGPVLAQGEQEGAFTFGIGVETFKIPIVPSFETLKQLVMDRAKAKLIDQVVARFQGQQPDPVTLEQFAKEVWEEAVKEVLDIQNLYPHRVERPALHFGLEVNRMFNLGSWAPRARFGFGFKKVSLGATLAFPLGGDAGMENLYPNRPVYLGFEVIVHIMMSRGPRSSVADVFVRADLEMRNRDTNTDALVIGVRYLLDLL